MFKVSRLQESLQKRLRYLFNPTTRANGVKSEEDIRRIELEVTAILNHASTEQPAELPEAIDDYCGICTEAFDSNQIINHALGIDTEYHLHCSPGGLEYELRIARVIPKLFRNLSEKVDIKFRCTYHDGEEAEAWDSYIRYVHNHGSHVEFTVSGCGSGFTVVVGEYASGHFMWIGVDQVGLELADPLNLLYNKEKALRCKQLNPIDGVIAVTAFEALAHAGHYPFGTGE